MELYDVAEVGLLTLIGVASGYAGATLRSLRSKPAPQPVAVAAPPAKSHNPVPDPNPTPDPKHGIWSVVTPTTPDPRLAELEERVLKAEGALVTARVEHALEVKRLKGTINQLQKDLSASKEEARRLR